MDLSAKVEKKDFDKVANRVRELPSVEEFDSFQIRIEKILEKFKESNEQ